MQKVVRGYLSRKQVNIDRCALAVVAIQSAWRSFSAQVRFEMELLDIVAVQSYFRAKKARFERNKRIRSVIIIQNAIRYAQALRCYNLLVEERRIQILRKDAAVVCQVRPDCIHFFFFLRMML